MIYGVSCFNLGDRSFDWGEIPQNPPVATGCFCIDRMNVFVSHQAAPPHFVTKLRPWWGLGCLLKHAQYQQPSSCIPHCWIPLSSIVKKQE